MMEDNDGLNHNEKKDYNLFQGQLLSHPQPGEEIVISGISGCFPLTENILRFQENLYEKKVMLRGNARWDFTHAQIPAATGAVPGAEKFDAGYFGIHERQSHSMDAMSRMVLEKTIEAIFDAGLHPSDLENSKTGVYVGACFSESEKYSFFDALESKNFAFTGVVRSMIAHRVSYFLKLKGPSFVSDTACSSSFYALEPAFRALRLGEIDTAIVAGANLCLHPFVTLQFARLGVLSKDGICKSFDEDADGYVRSEVIGVLILQRAKICKRSYAEIIHVKTNCDGFKATGITFPSKDSQFNLMKEVYDESGISPYSLSYLEAHGTGTGIGDPEECGAIDQLFTKGRTTSLLMGSVKSNIGHAEPASGIGSIIKCIIALENGYIPPNISFNTPNKRIRGIVEGRLEVVTDKIPFRDNRGLIGINSFGFGGGNCHLLMRGNKKVKVNKGLPSDILPMLVCISGRTNEAVLHLIDDLKDTPMDAEHVRLLHNVFRKNIDNHLYRGFSIVSKCGEIYRFSQQYHRFDVPLYIAFGNLENWCKIANDLMNIPIFRKTLQRIQRKLSTKRVDIIEIIKTSSEKRDTFHALGSAVVQMCLIDVLKILEITPKFHFGYSYGEMLSAYFDGFLSLEETVDCFYEINKSMNSISDWSIKNSDHQLNGGSEIGHRSINGSILENFRLALSSKNSTVIRKLLKDNLTNIIGTKPSKTNKYIESFATAEYFMEAMSSLISHNFPDIIEKDSILLKIGTFPFIDCIDGIRVISLFPDDSTCYMIDFLKILGNLYVNGHHAKLDSLYPEVKFPVSKGTKMISPHIKWKHDRNWFVPVYNVQQKAIVEQRGSRHVEMQLSDLEWAYTDGHVIDGRNLFPATAYLYLVWETICLMDDLPMNIRDIVFEDCRFLRGTALPAKGYLTYNIYINKTSGSFEICEGDYPVVTGKATVFDDNINYVSKTHHGYENIDGASLQLNTKDVYKELRLRGYNYKGAFRSILLCNVEATKALIKWEKNWVTFLDNMLQMKILSTDSRLLYVPTYISYLRIPAKAHLTWVVESYINKDIPTILPVFNNNQTNTISCGEIELRGLIASSIPRRKDPCVPVLEKYIFIPNITVLTLEQSVRVNMQVLLENALVYKVKTIEIIDNFTKMDAMPLTPIVKTAFEDQPLIQPIIKVFTKTSLDISVPVEDKNISEETDNLLVIASNLLERTELLKAVLLSLKENGFIISREPLSFDPALFQDNYDLCIYTSHRTDNETLILLRKITERKPPFVLKVSSDDKFSWMTTLKSQLKIKKTNDVILFSQNDPRSGILGLVNCLRREPDCTDVRCVFLVDDVEEFNVTSSFYAHQLRRNMAINIYKNGCWGSYRHLLFDNLKNIESKHCFVNTAIRGDLSSLTWFEGPLGHLKVPPEKKLVYVYYSALNFRDIMTASGKISNDVITRERIEQVCVQGFEFSGIDSSGNKVMGMLTHGALASLVQSDRYLTFKVPEGMTLRDAATVPVVYATVIYALLMRGRMKRGDSVLIHSGTGGVGQAAITIALYFNCKVYTTVGNQAKRDFLKKTFPQLQDRHIGNSHDLTFEKQIMRDTKGHGVDLVLNSLAEDKLQTSLRCVANGGRFLEIGKFDMANNNTINLCIMQKDLTFHGIMLDHFLSAPPYRKKRIANVLNEAIAAGYVKPLQATVFGFEQVEEAFRYMATGKHMGKVLVQIREDKYHGDLQSLTSSFSCKPRYSCDPQKSYIIIGGLGGFGLELTDWLILRGAKKIVLTSRTGMKTGYQASRIKCWKSYGTEIYISQANISSKDGCRQLIKEAQRLGDIAAIFNLAVILADALFENQTKENFVTSFGPKSVATELIDEVTRELCPDLRDFVVFSSVTCGRGNAGQTNYGMTNSVMERICEQRKQDGYPALAIQWGAIGEVGLVAEMQEIACELEIGGTLQQRISSCLEVLDEFLGNKDATIVSSMVVAEKRGGSYKAENIVQAVLNILGLNSAKSISHHCTLPELGMDSMTAVEIKQILERDFEVFLSPKDMRTMTLAKLKKIQEERNQVTNGEVDQTESNGGLDAFFRFSLIEGGQSESRLQLKSKNMKNTWKSVILPGIDGLVKIFEPMASQLHGEVIGLQYTNDESCTTIQNMAEILLPVFEEYLSEEANTFNIIAYSFGSIVAFEIAHILESKGYIGTIALVDGSPVLFKQVMTDMDCYAPESEKLLQTIILCNLMMLYMSPEVVSQQKESIYSCESWDERIDMSIRIVGDKSSYDVDQKRSAATGIYDRTKYFINYTPSYTKIKSEVKLFRATKNSFSHSEEDYGLSSICGHHVDVEYIEGDHASILYNESLSEAINNWMNDIAKNRNLRREEGKK